MAGLENTRKETS